MSDIEATQSIQNRVSELVNQANPSISPEVRGFVNSGVGQMAADLFKQIQKNPEAGQCAVITGVFKDRADNAYAGYQVEFDKKGNIIPPKAETPAAMLPGSQGAEFMTDQLRNSEMGEMINKGARDVRVGTQVPCGPK